MKANERSEWLKRTAKRLYERRCNVGNVCYLPDIKSWSVSSDPVSKFTVATVICTFPESCDPVHEYRFLGVAKRNPRDRFNYDVAENVALARAVDPWRRIPSHG